MNTACVTNEFPRDHVTMNLVIPRIPKDASLKEEPAQWTTKQMVAACLWSAFFGLGCGYAWLLIHVARNVCQ